MSKLLSRLSAALAASLVTSFAAAAPALAKSETLQCQDRTIVLEASCFELISPRRLSCASQRLTVSDASGKVLKVREFATMKVQGGASVVPEQFGEIACVATRGGGKFIVADMDNGGNCDDCEWSEVFDWNGAAVGSNRDKQLKTPVVKEALEAAVGKNGGRVIAKTDLPGFYSQQEKK